MLDLPKKILIPKNINPPRRHSELTIAIIQLVASRRGIAALPYWTVMPYLEKAMSSTAKLLPTDCKANCMPPSALKTQIKVI